MRDRYVVDTNVLIAGSAATNNDIDATPQDSKLKMQIWQWLANFEQSKSRLILDSSGKIEEEYRRNLAYQHYGLYVFQNKSDTCAIDYVHVGYDSDGHGILEEPLQTAIHDRSDRKMVAAALAALTDYGNSCIAFAADSDWHGWEDEIRKAGVELEPIIEQWSRAKYDEKKAK